jgi:acyl-CoA synthetase (NDP forming)
MLGVFHDSGFAVSAHRSVGAVELELPTSLSRDARRRFEERQRAADVAAVAHILRPASVAVIGASQQPATAGGEVVRNLRAGGFKGALHLLGARDALADVDGDVELAVLAVPPPAVLDAARACAAKGVHALVVLTADFTEVDELLAVCRGAGMRMLGPNCLGVANPRPGIALNATIAPHAPSPGIVGFASQSGALAIAAIDVAAARGIGFSSFVSMGDKADLSGNDFLEYWEQDPGTSVLLLHLESFGNPRRFGRLARRITTSKPIAVVKSGRAAAGRLAALSRTGSLLAASDVTIDALFAHAGVLRAETVGEMFDIAQLLARQPLPTGDRVAVLSNARGPGMLCVDACEAARLRPHLVSVAGSASADEYERSLSSLVADETVDAIVAIFVPPFGGRVAEVARAIASAAETADRPVLGVWSGADTPAAGDAGAVPRFSTPEEAVRALAHAVRHARRRAAPPDPPSEPTGVDSAAAATMVAAGLGRTGGWLPPGDVERLLRCWGIPVVAGRLVTSAHAAGRAAAELGPSVALKAVMPGVAHKSDAGAVRLGLRGPTAVRRAAGEMTRRLEEAGTPVEQLHVQRMAPAGTELIVGAVGDPAFGPLVACGAGGPAAELLGDVQIRLAPLGPREADGMLRDLRTFPLLDGYRGRPRVDVDSVLDLVLRIGALVATHPAVAELDLDPVIASPAGALVVDARVRVEAPGPAAPFPSLNV